MASNQKIIYVYESFKSTTPNFLGTLFVENVRGRESYSFEYDADWLKSSANYILCAGKGHETYQLINGEKIPFSEREIILREAALRRDTQAAPVENHDRIL